MKMILLISILGILVPCMVGATVLTKRSDGPELYLPLEDSHLIVRGTVAKVDVYPTTLGEWGAVSANDPASAWSIRAARVSVLVSEVLKGTWSERQIIFSVFGDGSLFVRSTEMIICARYRPSKGDYVAGEGLGLYLRGSGDSWVTCTSDAAIHPRSTVGDDALREQVRSTTLERVVSVSDVVVHGVVTATWVSEYKAEDGSLGVLAHYRLRIIELLKGESTADEIEFVAARIDAHHVPKWYRAVPNEIREGQEWFAFLRRGEKGLFPFAGLNSLLMVDGSNLIYDQSVDYPLGVSEAERTIRSQVYDAK